jgi:hypothetical protein
MAKHRPAYKRRAIEIATHVLHLEIQKQKVKEGSSSYRRHLPDDANWAEKFGNSQALRKGSILKQAAAKFGYKDVRQIRRYLDDVERQGWGGAVVAKYMDEGWNAAVKPGRFIFWQGAISGRKSTATIRRRKK